MAYIENIGQFVSEVLDKYEESNLLDWHGGEIPNNEIWIKIGADHGGGSFKVMLQVANLKHPNSKHNTFLLCIVNRKDSPENLQEVLRPYKEQVSALQNMQWKGKNIRLFLFGDYDFLLKLYGLSGAQAVHPCLWCTASKVQLQRSPDERPEVEQRTTNNIKRDY